MGLLTIVRLGHPAVRAGSEIVNAGECASQEFQTVLDDLVETMRHANGVGLAAPQVNLSCRAIVLEVTPQNPRYPGYPAIPLTRSLSIQRSQSIPRTCKKIGKAVSVYLTYEDMFLVGRP